MKKNTACHCLSVWANLLLFTYSLAAQTANAHEAVRFRIVRDNLIVVTVQVNSAGSCDFLLDTGTNTTVITPALAAHFNIHPVDRVEMITVAGSTTAARVLLRRLALGSRSTESIEALITELPELRKLDARVCGVLGQNFLARFNYLLDYRERRIEFVEPDENRWHGERLPVERNEGRLLLTAQPKKPSQTALKLVLDSAAPGLILFESGYRKLGGEIELSEGSLVQVATNAGRSTARSGILPRIRLGNKSFTHMPMTLLHSQSATQDRSEDGLLPTYLFSVIFFNNKEGHVILNPHKSR